MDDGIDHARTIDRAIPARAAATATRAVFLVAGCAMAAWAPLVPYAKARLAVGEGLLGLLLLCLGTGSIAAMPVAGALAARFGCRIVLLCAAAIVCLMLPVLATAADPVLLAAALVAFGAALGSLDCVINIQAVIVERASGRTMMSGFHGMFSVGGIAGAGGVAALLWLGLTPLWAVLAVVAPIAAAMAAAAPGLLTRVGRRDAPAFALPRGPVLVLGVLCLIVFLTEGSVLDWSAVFLTADRGADPAYAGLGYAAFAATMTLGRLTGDGIVRRLGPVRIMLFGGLLAAAGLALATFVPAWEAAILGYALVGAGAANIVPVLYTAIGRQHAMPEHVAVAAVTTIGYSGVLAGPALIGFIAEATSLGAAFLVVAALLVGVAFSGRLIAR